MIPILLAATLLVGGGVSVAAENALPGNPLYDVKTSVNEEVRGVLALNNEMKAQWETELMERRMKEAESLAAQGKLDAELFAEARANFQTHTSNARDYIQALYAEGKTELAQNLNAKLQSSIATHERIFLALEGTAGNTENDFTSLTNTMDAHIQALSSLEVSAEGDAEMTNDESSANNSSSAVEEDSYLEASVYESSSVDANAASTSSQTTTDDSANISNDTEVEAEGEASVSTDGAGVETETQSEGELEISL